MQYVNIPRDREDPNYRYKMPRLYSKIEGRGNGIKTNVSNMGDIAKALKRPPMYPTKFFGCELGAQCKYEESEEKSLFNGAHEENHLVTILDKFIQMYVLCPSCQLPEMDLIVKKGILGSKCNACGHLATLDMTHKAATYMIRNPPDACVSTVTVGKKKSKADRRTEKLAKKATIGTCVDDDTDEKKKKEKKEKRDKKEKDLTKGGSTSGGKSSRKSKEDATVSDDGDVEDSARISSLENSSSCPVSNTPDSATPNGTHSNLNGSANSLPLEEKKKKKKKDKSDYVDKLQFNEKLNFNSAEIEDVIGRLKDYYSANSNCTPSDFCQEVRLLQVAQDFDSKLKAFVTICSLFGEDITTNVIEEKSGFLKRLCSSDSTPPSSFMEALEYFVVETCHGRPLANFPYIVQCIYQQGILESDEILKHYSNKKLEENPRFVQCRKVAEPVLAWLAENDSEEETDSSEDETSPTSNSKRENC